MTMLQQWSVAVMNAAGNVVPVIQGEQKQVESGPTERSCEG